MIQSTLEGWNLLRLEIEKDEEKRVLHDAMYDDLLYQLGQQGVFVEKEEPQKEPESSQVEDRDRAILLLGKITGVVSRPEVDPQIRKEIYTYVGQILTLIDVDVAETFAFHHTNGQLPESD
jgi:hypothetical protein